MWEAYVFRPKTLQELVPNAKVVVDTNVLLSAYQWRGVTVDQVIKCLERLSDEGRLFIPGHVVREFTMNRPGRIAEMMQQIDVLKSKYETPKGTLNESIPTLSGSDKLNGLIELDALIKEKVKEIRNRLTDLKEEIHKLVDSDPVLDKFIKIFQKSCRQLDSRDVKEIEKEASERIRDKKPPGYKDGNKEVNSSGDAIIWLNMLSLKEDVIFVSGDIKADWVIKGPNDIVLTPRRELIEEFYERTDGKSFCFATPKEFFTQLMAEENKDVVDDLSNIAYSNFNRNDTHDKIHSLMEALQASLKIPSSKNTLFLNDTDESYYNWLQSKTEKEMIEWVDQRRERMLNKLIPDLQIAIEIDPKIYDEALKLVFSTPGNWLVDLDVCVERVRLFIRDNINAPTG